MLNIVLVEPEIPQNCGNIARTCAATGSRLHLIRPLGFDISEKAVRRAGLDYWHMVDVQVYDNLDDFFQKTRSTKCGVFPPKPPGLIPRRIFRTDVTFCSARKPRVCPKIFWQNTMTAVSGFPCAVTPGV